MNVAVLGTGRMARGLASSLREQHSLVISSRDSERGRRVARELGVGHTTPRNAVESADVVIPAVPFHALFELVASLGDLRGKIVVDITYANVDDTYLTVLDFDGRSAAEALQERIPAATVVKAWNHVWAEVVASPLPVSVFTAGEEWASAIVGELVRDSGFVHFHAGPLEAARYLEQYAAFLVYLGYARGLGERFAFDVVTPFARRSRRSSPAT